MCYPLFGKQESQESIQESQSQAKIPKDSRITSIQIQSYRSLELECVNIPETVNNSMQLCLVFQCFAQTTYKQQSSN